MKCDVKNKETILRFKGRAFMSRVDGYNIFNKIGDVYLFGGRGISLWDSTTMAHVFDSGDDLERRASQNYPNTFNGECSNGNQSPTQQVDERSPYMVRSTNHSEKYITCIITSAPSI